MGVLADKAENVSIPGCCTLQSSDAVNADFRRVGSIRLQSKCQIVIDIRCTLFISIYTGDICFLRLLWLLRLFWLVRFRRLLLLLRLIWSLRLQRI